MPAADNIGGAFLYGEGLHGYMDAETGYFMDDLWFYDLLAHRWICLYPGTSREDMAGLILNDRGFVARPDGMYQPVATQIHGYSNNTYDSNRRLFMSPSVMRNGYFSAPLLPELRDLHDHPDRYRGPQSPWTYSVATGRFDRRATTNPGSVDWRNSILYIPTQDRMFGWTSWGASPRRAAFYDPEANDWSQIEAEGPAIPYGWDVHSTYDSRRDRIYFYGSTLGTLPEGSSALRVYDLSTNTWIDPNPSGPLPSTALDNNNSSLHYDASADVVVLFVYGGSTRGIWAYDPNTNIWERSGDFPGADWDARRTKSGFYNAELNVHVIFLSRDSEVGGTDGDGVDIGAIWVYRH